MRKRISKILSLLLVFITLSSTIFDLEKERHIINDILHQRGLHPVMSDIRGAFDVYDAQEVHSHDLCLLNIDKCKGFIFVIGEKYGGEYAGDKFKNEMNEIVTQSNNKIKKPSVSLMEFYLARKKGLKCYVFSSIDVEKRKRDFDEIVSAPKGKMVAEEIDTEMARIKCEIDFINHFKLPNDKHIKGNWIEWYRDISDLSSRISKCKFV